MAIVTTCAEPGCVSIGVDDCRTLGCGNKLCEVHANTYVAGWIRVPICPTCREEARVTDPDFFAQIELRSL